MNFSSDEYSLIVEALMVLKERAYRQLDFETRNECEALLNRFEGVVV